jgi:hypothetical protein
VVNSTGGLEFGQAELHNEIQSPYLAWPSDQYGQGLLSFNVYRHSVPDPGTPGIFYYWKVRSTSESDQSDLQNAPWRNRGMLYYGSRAYDLERHYFGDLLVPGSQWVQVALGVRQSNDIWGSSGIDATPAPYFDNVEVLALRTLGPSITARALEMGQDAFPASGTLDPGNLATNSVRFDMARGSEVDWPLSAATYDSLVFSIRPASAGGQVHGQPRLYYTVNTNPIFDPYRTSGMPNSGFVEGAQVYNQMGIPVPDLFSFDLPDDGFLFPGDELHYYVYAEENDGLSIFEATLPRDITDFGIFGTGSTYPSAFTIRALPSVEVMGSPGSESFAFPPILWWDDGGESGHREVWEAVLDELGLVQGTDFDIFRPRSPNAGYANGLGSRATLAQIEGYETIIYTCGTLAGYALTTGVPERDPGNDIALFESWLQLGDKNLFLAGDNLAADLHASGPAGQAFLATWLGVDFQVREVKPYVGNQDSPGVDAVDTNPVFDPAAYWLLSNNCGEPSTREFDAVTATGNGERLAEYRDIGGGNPYSQSAATLVEDPVSGSQVISLPYDLSAVTALDGGFPPSPLSAAAYVLGTSLTFFDLYSDCSVVPSALHFGEVPLGSYVDRDLTIQNTGLVPLTGDVTLDCEHYSIQSGGGPFSLDPGSIRYVTVRYEPAAEGSHTCSLETGTLTCGSIPLYGRGRDCSLIILHVDGNATGADTGASWDDAFTSLFRALAAVDTLCGGSMPPTEIWVAEGTYEVNDPPFLGPMPFPLKNGVAVYGGFAGDETERSRRDFRNRPTILSGEAGGGGPSDNAQHVIHAENVDETAILDGFTITRGYADGSGDDGDGGGILVKNGSPVLRHLVILDNTAAFSSGRGGGLHIRDGSPVLENIMFLGNHAGLGGALSLSGNPSHLQCYGAVFSGNEASSDGGALYIDNGNILSQILSATIVGNTTSGEGGGIFIQDGDVQATNTIVWGNQANQNANVSVDGASDLTWAFSLIEGCGGSGPGWNVDLGIDGGNNLDANPLFVDPNGPDNMFGTEDDNYDLQGGSPAIDTGDSAVPGLPATDIVGRYRVHNGQVDMGAYEFGSPVVDVPREIPVATRLGLAYPNPFNPRVTLAFELAKPGTVRLGVFDIRGRLVREIVSGEFLNPGHFERQWNGIDQSGQPVAGGLYFYRLETSGYVATKKMVLLK